MGINYQADGNGVQSNFDEILSVFEDEAELIEALDGLEAEVYNDLPYGNVVDGGFTHAFSGKKIQGYHMLASIDAYVDENLDMFNLITSNRFAEVDRTKRIKTFFSDLKSMVQKKWTPIKSGLLSYGSSGVINRGLADKRYVDGSYDGWGVSVTK